MNGRGIPFGRGVACDWHKDRTETFAAFSKARLERTWDLIHQRAMYRHCRYFLSEDGVFSCGPTSAERK